MNTFPHDNNNARASVVNRTHRIVREQALDMRAQQERKRSLWVPLGIFSVLLPVICYAVWAVLEGYDLNSDGILDASDQLLIMLMWFLPVTALMLGTIWFRRTRAGSYEVSR
jgi:hypothetical protein